MSRRGKKKSQSHMDESWLLPYADLLTLLVALFIVLFAMSDINIQKYEQLASVFRSEFSNAGSGVLDHQEIPVPPPEQEEVDENEDSEEQDEQLSKSESELRDLQALQTQINHFIQEHELTEQLGTELTDEGLMITLVNEVFFDSGSAEVKETSKEIANDVSNLLYTEPPHQVVISGHADDVPIETEEYNSNWELSVSRAINFMTLILENEELDPTLFSAKGYGEFQPIVPNTSAENRAKNRRVEVLILPNYDIQVPE
ncbi:flagellar motor protein MotB [Oceanobacillus iheyensis]|uniref:Motility protein B (Flagellar motor rotation) n=1 Tax=Oceanobacillus iheyensis (strain DSM 14371 / CIP 107618 / JCM 11309 / KCTC 3954 / HTE831) TaxID=221109 RepID=Q8CX95_OCEIH|nr:flagellar motor protein MotB [Oceanobacillus iheyensis]BAC14500.1 motility protein B (flagellar motor rotation) [Oceanobacillus iheyensis HTE831]